MKSIEFVMAMLPRVAEEQKRTPLAASFVMFDWLCSYLDAHCDDEVMLRTYLERQHSRECNPSSFLHPSCAECAGMGVVYEFPGDFGQRCGSCNGGP